VKSAWALVCLGLVQMLADVADLTALKGFAAATGAAPAPKVFSEVKGLETYSTRFLIEWEEAGETHSHELRPESYARLRGPYPRRNAYGAALAYGPILESQASTRALYRSAAGYALCGERPLLRELGIDFDGQRAENLRVRLLPREGNPLEGLKTTLRAPCP